MSEVGRGCWNKEGGATPWYELTVAPTPNVGSAWAQFVSKNKPLPDPSIPTAYKAVHYGVRALQSTLVRRGYKNIIVDGWLGKASDVAIRDYQAKNNLVVDGKVGPNTAAHLLRLDLIATCNKYAIEIKVLDGILNWESGYDFGGMGINNWDTGVVQIDLDPQVHGGQTTFDQAMDPIYAIEWAAKAFAGARTKLKPFCDASGANLTEVCVADHNSPAAALAWAKAGHAVYDPKRDEQIDHYVFSVLSHGRAVL